MKIEFQSTPSAWRETVSLLFFSVCVPISIHSLRMEGDQIFHSVYNIVQDFNPLPPHGGRRRCSKSATSSSRFQSTPSAWRETDNWDADQMEMFEFQSTPSAWRETYIITHNANAVK